MSVIPLLGPTGEFPDGKLDETDEGELQIGITHREGQVILAFGKSIAWLGFPPAQARAMAAAFLQHADMIEHEDADA
jgi:hypothetical protein